MVAEIYRERCPDKGVFGVGRLPRDKFTDKRGARWIDTAKDEVGCSEDREKSL